MNKHFQFKSQLFDHDDHKQFVECAKTLNDALKIFDTVAKVDMFAKIIAEFATGKVLNCPGCGIDIHVLEQDVKEYQKQSHGTFKFWNYDEINKTYSCNDCVYFTCCNNYQYVKNKKQCIFHNNPQQNICIFSRPYEPKCVPSYQCDYCSYDGTCDTCDEYICEEHKIDCICDQGHRACCTMIEPCYECDDLVCIACLNNQGMAKSDTVWCARS